VVEPEPVTGLVRGRDADDVGIAARAVGEDVDLVARRSCEPAERADATGLLPEPVAVAADDDLLHVTVVEVAGSIVVTFRLKRRILLGNDRPDFLDVVELGGGEGRAVGVGACKPAWPGRSTTPAEVPRAGGVAGEVEVELGVRAGPAAEAGSAESGTFTCVADAVALAENAVVVNGAWATGDADSPSPTWTPHNSRRPPEVQRGNISSMKPVVRARPAPKHPSGSRHNLRDGHGGKDDREAFPLAPAKSYNITPTGPATNCFGGNANLGSIFR
jgi:hypothetical protein